MMKTKVMFHAVNMKILIISGPSPFCVCSSTLERIYCSWCKDWVHKNSSEICDRVVRPKIFCLTGVRALSDLSKGALVFPIPLGEHTFEVIDTFCNFGKTVPKIDVNMVQLLERNMHGKVLTNIGNFHQLLYPQQNSWKDFLCVSHLSCCMVESAGHWELKEMNSPF